MTKIHVQHQLMMPQTLTAAGWNLHVVNNSQSTVTFVYCVETVKDTAIYIVAMECE